MATFHGTLSRRLRRAAAACFVLAAISCRADSPPNEIAVIASDYAYRAPDSVPAGPTILSFENTGHVPHEMIFARICDDVSNKAFADSLVRDARMITMRATGSAVLFAAPGRRNQIVRLGVEFRRGERYALWCRFQDSTGAPRHTALGMLKLLAVK